MSLSSKHLSPGKIIVIYLVAFLLVSVHEMDRVADWVENMALERSAGARTLEVIQDWRGLMTSIGLTRLWAAEDRLLSFKKELPVIGGTGEEPVMSAQAETTADSPPGPGAATRERTVEGGIFSTGLPRMAALDLNETEPSDMVLERIGALPGTLGPAAAADASGGGQASGSDNAQPVKPINLKPKNVLIAGDSLVLEGFGVALERRLSKIPGLEVARAGKYSSGLSRPDYFDWNAYLKTILQKHNPDLLIVHLGANDPQDILDEKRKRHFVGSEGWNEIYGHRVRHFLDLAKEKGVQAIWVGLPIMGQKKYGGRIEILNAVAKKACQSAPNCQFVDTWYSLADKKNRYHTFSKDEKGRTVRIRAKDKIHLTEAGGEIMVDYFLNKIAGFVDFKANPPAADVEVELFKQESKFRNKTVEYYAFVPKPLSEKERFPVLYLLHGAMDDYTAWKTHCEQDLKNLAAKYRMIIITPDGDEYGWYADSALAAENQIESYFIKELIPHVEASLPVAAGKRAICGLSMGGHGAFVLALRNPGVFQSVSAMSGVMDITRHHGQWQLDRVFGPFNQDNIKAWMSHSVYFLAETRAKDFKGFAAKFSVSTGDRWTLTDNRMLHSRLESLGIKHEYDEAPGDHDWPYWTAQLPLHAAFHGQILNGGAK